MTSRQLPKTKPTPWDALIVGCVIALGVLAAAVSYGGHTSADALTVVVSIGGQEVSRTALCDMPDGETAYSHNGYTLYLSPAPDGAPAGVCVSRCDCPTQDCVHTGTITRAGQSIVCLPAQIVIHLEGTPAADAPDLIVG